MPWFFNDGDMMELRNIFALKFVPTKEAIDLEMKMDVAKNPHNDYHKPRRRTYNEVISDLSFKYADEVLVRQYGDEYKNVLKSYCKFDDSSYTWHFRNKL